MRRTSLALVSSTVMLAALGMGFTSAASAHGAAGPALTVDLLAGRHPVSRDIYGMNFAPRQPGTAVEAAGGPLGRKRHHQVQLPARYRQPCQRLVLREHPQHRHQRPGALPNGSTADQFIGQNRRHGTDSIITVPLIGWTPKARAQACGFSVAKYGPQQSTDPYDSDCGNGVTPGGSYITGNNPADTSKHAGAGFVAGWVKYLDHRYGTAAHGGVRFYQLDNEPDIWFATHRDVHPAGATYGQMLRRTESAGAAIKAADPAAQTIGPSGWGWSSLFYSGYDQQYCALHTCGPVPPDMARHGGVPFAAWYLRKLRAYQHKTGVRLLDYFDNHWYPQEANVDSEDDSPATQALRLRSTRMLWDPHYVDQSWINKPVMAIPRMKQLVAQNYPGTKVAITEYNWGALDKMDGGLAAGRRARHLRPRGPRSRDAVGPAEAHRPGRLRVPHVPELRRQGSAFGRHQRPGHQCRPGQAFHLRRAAQHRPSPDDHRDQQDPPRPDQPVVRHWPRRQRDRAGLPVWPGPPGSDRDASPPRRSPMARPP